MDRFKPASKHEFIKAEILKIIKEQGDSNNQLPSEGYLAKEFGVSLATVRQALLVLKKEGVISKKHGSGNYIHRSVLNSSMRVDKFIDFINLLEESGYQASWSQSESELITRNQADYSSDLSQLGLGENAEVVHYIRTFYADGNPAIVAHNYVPYHFYNVKIEEIEKVDRIYDYMWIYCGQEMTHALFEFIPINADKEEQEIFKLTGNLPMITWKEIFYTLEDAPICFSRVAFNPSIMKMRMLWRC